MLKSQIIHQACSSDLSLHEINLVVGLVGYIVFFPKKKMHELRSAGSLLCILYDRSGLVLKHYIKFTFRSFSKLSSFLAFCSLYRSFRFNRACAFFTATELDFLDSIAAFHLRHKNNMNFSNKNHVHRVRLFGQHFTLTFAQ